MGAIVEEAGMPKFAARLVDRGWGYAEQQWEIASKAKEGTLRWRVYRLALSLMSNIKPSESFLMSVPLKAHRKCASIEVIYPKTMDSRVVRDRLVSLVRTQAAEHRRAMWMWCAALPVIMPIGILPVPNLPFYWNVYRIYCNWRAAQGGEQLQKLIMDRDGASPRPTVDPTGNARTTDGEQPTSPPVTARGEAFGDVGVNTGGVEHDDNGDAACMTADAGPCADASATAHCCMGVPDADDERGDSEARGFKLIACEWLDAMAKPKRRMTSMLSDARAGMIARRFNLASFDETLVRLRKAAGPDAPEDPDLHR